MDQMEQVESLREKTGCSYTEAKTALEHSGNDLLEALCWLEQHGKNGLVSAAATSEQKEQKAQPKQEKPREPGAFKRGVGSLWDGLVQFFRCCNETNLVMTNKQGHREFGIPLSLLILLLILAWWAMVVLLIVALFFGNRFSLEGNLSSPNVNEALGKATEFAESVKEKISADEEKK